MNENPYGPMLRDKEVAKQLGWSLQHLWNQRCKGKHSDDRLVPKYIKYGRRLVLTPQTEVNAFIEAHLIGP